MRRFWTLLVAVAVALVIALPAGAAKPDKPGKPPAQTARYAVTMELIDEHDGIFTTLDECTDGGFLEMELSHGVALVNTEVSFLQVEIGSINWDRHYPYIRTPDLVPVDFNPNHYPATVPSTVPGLTGEELTGCHGGGADVNAD